MRKFLVSICFFISVCLIVLGTAYSVTNKIIDRNADFGIDENIHSIFIGHSHSECAINDTFFLNYKNLSRSGESFFYIFQKLEKLLSQNNHIKTVFIEFSNDQINNEMDQWIWGDKYISYNGSIYIPFLNLKDHFLLFRKNFSGYQRAASLVLRSNTKRIVKNDYDYSNNYGGFLSLKRNKTDSLLALKYINQNNQEISGKNIEYLRKIIELCNIMHKNIYFIRSPIHPRSNVLQNESLFQEIRDQNFKNIDFLDFKNFPLNNSEYGDLEHLNYKGAKLFSQYLSGMIQAGLLNSFDKQKNIDGSIDSLKILGLKE